MFDPLRFLIRHGNIVAALLVSLLAVIGAEQEDGFLPLVSASLIAAAALSVQAAERMAVLEHRSDWWGATRREAELRDRFMSLQATLSEI
jgi:hypothetical protein